MMIFGVSVFTLLPMLFMGMQIYRRVERNRRFINPLTKSMARPPGTQLARELSAEYLEVGFGAAELALPLLLPLTAVLGLRDLLEAGSVFAWTIVTAILFGWLWYSKRKSDAILSRFDRIRILRLAYECELAVGQELDQLMRSGFRVFHDLQFQGFNVDHIVVGAAGVFAVETKGRSKRDDGGKTAYRVIYENGLLEFPHGTESGPPKQAARQARQVGKWLTLATGFAVSACPVVVLPGWYIELRGRPRVPVIASGFISRYFNGLGRKTLTEQQVQQICYQIEQKVRDLDPGELIKPVNQAG